MINNFEIMPNGEKRFRLIGNDNSGYIRTEASIAGGWQKSHYHEKTEELYIVQRGWVLLLFEKKAKLHMFRYEKGSFFSVPPKLPHTMYLSKNAITHTVKFGDCEPGDWHEYNLLDSARNISNRIKKAISSSQIKYVSFDVFDTLICRPFFKPVDLFLLLGENIPREQAERLAREKHSLFFPEHEDINLEEIYEELKLLTNFSSEEINELKEKEIQFELDYCIPRPIAKELFEFAKKCGKQIIITSDMYLSSTSIESILRKCGFDGWRKVFISSEYRKTKSSGNLYTELLNWNNIHPKSVLHIGDNLQADIYSAKTKGINSYYLPQWWTDKKQLFANRAMNKICRKFFFRKNPLFCSKIQKYSKTLKSESKIIDFVARETSAQFSSYPRALVETTSFVTSPVLLSFVIWIINHAQKNNLTRLYFLSRDGFILFQIAQEICNSFNISIELKYLYASRIALRYPLYHKMGKRCSEYLCVYSKEITRRVILNRFLLTHDEEIIVKKALHFDDSMLDEPLTNFEINSIKNKINDSELILSIVEKKSKEFYDSEFQYFKQEGLFDSVNYAIVDSGWTGSMQVFINDILQTHGHRSVPGFYFGLFSYASVDSRESYFPYCFSPNNIIFKQFFNNNIIECMCSAPTGSTLYYYSRDGIYLPHFSSEENINNKQWYVKEQIEIIKTFVQNYTHYFSHNPNSLDNRILSLPCVKKLLKTLILSPSKEEAELYGSYLFSDDLMETELKQMAPVVDRRKLASAESFPTLIKFLFYKKNRNFSSFWIHGTLKRSCKKTYYWYKLNIFVIFCLRILKSFLLKKRFKNHGKVL